MCSLFLGRNFGSNEMIGGEDELTDKIVVEIIEIEVTPVDLVHVIGGTHSIITLTKFQGFVGRKFHGDLGLGGI